LRDEGAGLLAVLAADGGDATPPWRRSPAEALLQISAAAWRATAQTARSFSAHDEQGAEGAEPERAAVLYERACVLHDDEGCRRLTHVRWGEPPGPDDTVSCAERRRRNVRVCRSGEPEGCFRAGDVHERGYGVTRDLEGAKRYYAQACAAQHPEAGAAAVRLGAPKDRGRNSRSPAPAAPP
jgi:TPR repeat protein